MTTPAPRWARQDEFDSAFYAASSRYGVPVALLKAVAAHESSFNPLAVNPNDPPSGAFGIMQMLEPTARGLGYTGPMGGLLEQPALAVELGAKLLAENMRRTAGSVADSLSAYNGGFRPSLGFGEPLNGRYRNQSYVDSVLSNYQYFESWEAMRRGAPSVIPWLTVAAVAVVIGWRAFR